MAYAFAFFEQCLKLKLMTASHMQSMPAGRLRGSLDGKSRPQRQNMPPKNRQTTSSGGK
jgi:hypothetical protein